MLRVSMPSGRLRVGAAVVIGLCAIACGSSDTRVGGTATAALVSASPSITASPGTTAPATAPTEAPAEPDVAQVLAHTHVLSVEIGSRPAGTPEERTAADYIAGVLDEAGYDVTIEEFPFQTSLDRSHVLIEDGSRIEAVTMAGGADGEVTGRLVYAGMGEAADVAAVPLRGRIVLFDRGTIPFSEKVLAAIAGNAAGVIVVNQEAGAFRGTLGDLEVDIPVVAIAGAHRDALRDAVGRRVTVASDGQAQYGTSQNVVAVSGVECRAYLGAHYDSVPQGPGANDNASGVAVLLEVARARITSGLCVVAFGAEEIGLWGSRAYVEGHLAGTSRFMLNVDMAGRLGDPVVVGDRGLTDRILALIEATGIDSPLRAGAFPPFSSSDHVSFTAVGVPAVTFNAGRDPAIHTSEDSFERIDPAALEVMLQGVDAALTGLLAEAGMR